MKTPEPQEATFHEGEVKLQATLGVAERMGKIAQRVIRSYMPEQHRIFFAQLPFLVAGAVDPEGQVWPTFLSGEPGFAHSPTPQSLSLTVVKEEADPAWRGLGSGDAVGLLGIELHTRRRNRLNGTLSASPTGLEVKVGHSFGNCPQYIQRRELRTVDRDLEPVGPVLWSEALTARARVMVEAADSFYVASYVDRAQQGRQIDVSHRGGKAGFVRVGDDGVLTIPDFAGNLFFNTLGNFLVNPRAGLLFVDFDKGDMLQLTGTAEVILEDPEIQTFEGAERLWRFTPASLVLREAALPFRWRFLDWSPNSLMTGSWAQAKARVEALRHAQQWRPFTVTRIVDESTVVRSVYLQPADGGGVVRHEAGQHLPVRVRVPGHEAPLMRTYTISVDPSDPELRISVKREGVVSGFVHTQLNVGDVIEARAPAGAFTVDAQVKRPAVLLGAGIGITPMLAMLRHIVFEGLRTRHIRPTLLLYAAQNVHQRAFDLELAELLQRAKGSVRLVRIVSKPEPQDKPGLHYDVQGRVSGQMLEHVALSGDCDFYLCGPSGFMQSVYDDLRGLGVPDDMVHAEAFGPASLQRRPDQALAPLAAVADLPVRVVFASSGKEARWSPGVPNLLELAESRGLSPAWSCRLGNCGSCKVKLHQGQVTYTQRPGFAVKDGEALLCCALPASSSEAPLVLEV